MSIKNIPYFYIIKHILTGLKYAGAKWAKNSNPVNFMTDKGYKTSSDKVKEYIEKDGLTSFSIELIITDFGPTMDAYSYETVFLQTWDIANDKNWLNKHNNETYAESAYGSDEFYAKMINTYGVKNCMQVERVKHKHVSTILERYGAINVFMVEEFKQKSNSARLEHYGVEHYAQTEIAKMASSTLHKGKTVWNDGVRNYDVKCGEVPELHWVPGFLPRKPRSLKHNEENRLRQLGSKLWNDGVRNHKVKLGEIPEANWVLGKIRK